MRSEGLVVNREPRWFCPGNWHIQVFLSDRRERKRTLELRLSSHHPSSPSLCILPRKADLYIFYLILSLTSIKNSNLPRRPLRRLIGNLAGTALFKCSCLMGYWQSCLIWPIRAPRCTNGEQKLENHGEEGRGDMEEKPVGNQLGENDSSRVTAPKTLPETRQRVTAALQVQGAARQAGLGMHPAPRTSTKRGFSFQI